MEVKIKKFFPGAIIPKYAHEGDAAMDLYAFSKDSSNPKYIEYGTGIGVKIPEGHVGLIFPRSSNSNFDLQLTNSVAVIDPNYVGEIKLRYRRIKRNTPEGVRVVDQYNVGDRVGQFMIIPYPSIEFKEVDELPKTNRGENGFGSSGK